MNAADLRKIVGTSGDGVEHAPVAMLLRSGYACYGQFNRILNDGLTQTAMILNAQLMELKAHDDRHRPAVEDFREFLLEIVAAYDEHREGSVPVREDLGKTVPLIAIPMDEIAIVYPVAHIVELLRRASDGPKRAAPALFDLDQSEILAMLRMKLW
ncbi:MAG: hypothetical protein ACYTGL_30335 [Planctomycetota bacterium]|jgi:hypothetical protein